ncbi:hypothetical protein [Bacteroides sp. UBA939]|uniref:hypothetical protein n=1 Tax=Bacteroides sp. UBA939 TaxID=1946092 RepID=UPI0025BAE282|nr:hypothetical protein [Bacteroides sp. UBA939]
MHVISGSNLLLLPGGGERTLLVGGILQQLFFRAIYEGNLIFEISNESLVDYAQLEIFIDGTKIIDNRIRNDFHSYKPYPTKVTLGNHTILIKINGETAKEIKVNTFLVTFITVEYYGDRFDFPGYDKEHFNISIRKRPIIFIA